MHDSIPHGGSSRIGVLAVLGSWVVRCNMGVYDRRCRRFANVAYQTVTKDKSTGSHSLCCHRGMGARAGSLAGSEYTQDSVTMSSFVVILRVKQHENLVARLPEKGCHVECQLLRRRLRTFWPLNMGRATTTP
jgi:hypothetical protein